MAKGKYIGPETISYKMADLSELKYIKIIYTDSTGEAHEIKTETNYLSDNYLSLYFNKIKEEEIDEEKEEKIRNWGKTKEDKQNSETLSLYRSEYLKKIAEIKQIKELAEKSGNFKENYRKLMKLQASKEESDPRQEQNHQETVNIENEQPQQQEQEQSQEESKDQDKQFEANCPQEIILKFIIGDLLYMSQAQLEHIDIKATKVYFKISAPEILKLQQNRKFYRINLRRLCIIIATNEEGSSSAFIARSINLSAGGVLINRLEAMAGEEYVKLNPEEYKTYNLIIILETDRVLKLSARYVRQEEGKKSYRYAFEFINVEEEKTDYLSKYIIGKQIEELRTEYDIKNKMGKKMNGRLTRK